MRAPAGPSALAVQNSPLLSQAEPARIEVFDASDGGVHELNAAYGQAARTAAGVEAAATIRSSPTVSFLVRDVWELHDEVLSVQRTVSVEGSGSGGFSSAVVFSAPKLVWNDASYLAPGVLYADPTYDGERSPGGTLLYAAHHLSLREEILPAPLSLTSGRRMITLGIWQPFRGMADSLSGGGILARHTNSNWELLGRIAASTHLKRTPRSRNSCSSWKMFALFLPPRRPLVPSTRHKADHYAAVRPPSMGIATPLMNAASSLAR